MSAVHLIACVGVLGLTGPYRPFADAIKTCSSSSLARARDVGEGMTPYSGRGPSLDLPEYSLIAWISYARGFSGTYDSAENEYPHKKFPGVETLHFHRHFASCVTSGP